MTSPQKTFEGEVLTTERLRLRWMRASDLPLLHALLSDPLVMKYYPKLLDEEETRGWIERVLAGYQKYGHGLYIVEARKAGEFIGQIGLIPQIVEGQYQPELGYLIRSQCFGQGFATEAGRACLEYGFKTLPVGKLISLIRPENTPSRAVAQRLGLTPEKEIEWKGGISIVHSITKEVYNLRFAGEVKSR